MRPALRVAAVELVPRARPEDPDEVTERRPAELDPSRGVGRAREGNLPQGSTAVFTCPVRSAATAACSTRSKSRS
jgi:hypothetical protein